MSKQWFKLGRSFGGHELCPLCVKKGKVSYLSCINSEIIECEYKHAFKVGVCNNHDLKISEIKLIEMKPIDLKEGDVFTTRQSSPVRDNMTTVYDTWLDERSGTTRVVDRDGVESIFLKFDTVLLIVDIEYV